MLHDLGQAMWPGHQTADANLWRQEPWDRFDVGILPGRTWSQAWRVSCARPTARPRIGVFELGYPKADRAVRDRAGFEGDVRRLRGTMALEPGPSILVAPSWESDVHNRCEGSIQALEGLDANLLIKYQAGDEGTARSMAERFGSVSDRVRLIDVDQDIMTCLALADIVVSDESNCLAEALLLEVPGLAVVDWDVPAVSILGPAASSSRSSGIRAARHDGTAAVRRRAHAGGPAPASLGGAADARRDLHEPRIQR
jgi:hypothetical protein